MWKKVNFQLLSVIQHRHGKEIRKKKPRTQKRPHEFLCFMWKHLLHRNYKVDVFDSISNLLGSPSAGIGILRLLFEPWEWEKFRQEMILPSAFPALKGGCLVGDAVRGLLGDTDLDLITTEPSFSGRRGHSHTQWLSLAYRLWLWCTGVGCTITSSSVSEDESES